MTDKYSGHTSGLWMPMRNYMAVYSDQMKVCDIRGWGHLTGKGIGALGLSDDEAIAVQTANARLIADAPKLLEENKRLREASQWQPIETAPKDGSMLLLWSKGIHLGSWCIDDGYSGDEEPSWFDNSWDSFTTGYSACPLNPTHWMPLPEPPKESEDGL